MHYYLTSKPNYQSFKKFFFETFKPTTISDIIQHITSLAERVRQQHNYVSLLTSSEINLPYSRSHFPPPEMSFHQQNRLSRVIVRKFFMPFHKSIEFHLEAISATWAFHVIIYLGHSENAPLPLPDRPKLLLTFNTIS